MRGEHRVTAAIDKAEHVVVHDLLAEPDAARAKNAALVIERDARPELHRFRLFHLVLEKARTGRAVLDTEFLQLAFARLIADRAIERMIDDQKFHHSALTFLHQRRVRAHAHAFAHFLRAGNLRTRHPVDDWFAVLAQLRSAVRAEPRHSHFNQTHPAIARRAELLVIAITRHKNAGLRARLDHPRAFRKLKPRAINLDVEQ